jgi:signal transduction histidine kinase
VHASVARLLDNLPTPVLLFEAGALAYANPAARTLLGLGAEVAHTPAEALGLPALADAVTETAETGRALELEVRREDRHLVARTNETADGEVALVLTDLSEVRRVEALRRDFVTNASHELKTPVAAIQALSESLGLAFERNPERARGMVRRLQVESERLSRLVRDLLDLSRLEEAGLGAGRQRIDLAQLVRVQLDRLSRVAAQRGVTLHADCPEPVVVGASPGDLRLVVGNLLENAVQYNRPGGEVRASVRRDGATACFEVADSGVGIPAADLDRVFERFYRVDKGRSRLAGGTGLGLSIARHAVEGHGGSISVESTVGLGTTFRVVLPLADAG